MVSATGQYIPGSTQYPEISSIIYRNTVDTQTCRWNISLYIPGVSTVTGFGLALLGLVHTINHLTRAVFDSQNRNFHLQEAKLGAVSILKGIVGMVPIAGNSILLIKDFIVAFKESKNAVLYLSKHRNKCFSNMVLVVGDKKVASKNEAELEEFLVHGGFEKKPSFWQLSDFLLKKV